MACPQKTEQFGEVTTRYRNSKATLSTSATLSHLNGSTGCWNSPFPLQWESSPLSLGRKMHSWGEKAVWTMLSLPQHGCVLSQHAQDIKSRKKYIAFSFQIFLPITVVYCVDVVLIFKTLFFHNEFWRKKIFFSNLKAENWLSVFHCSPGTSHAWGRKPRWSWLLQEIEVVWKCKELDMTECLSMHAWKWIMKKQEFCEN